MEFGFAPVCKLPRIADRFSDAERSACADSRTVLGPLSCQVEGQSWPLLDSARSRCLRYFSSDGRAASNTAKHFGMRFTLCAAFSVMSTLALVGGSEQYGLVKAI